MKTAHHPKAANAGLPEDIQEVASQWANRFNEALSSQDFVNVFLAEFYWRDHLSLSWDFRTLDNLSKINLLLRNSCKSPGLLEISLDVSKHKPRIDTIGSSKPVPCVTAVLTVKTRVGEGRGVVKLVQDPNDLQWKAYTLYTCLQQLDGHQESIKHHRPLGLDYVDRKTGKTWVDHRDAQRGFGDNYQPVVLIVGKMIASLIFSKVCHAC
jgi:hypothetical protein